MLSESLKEAEDTPEITIDAKDLKEENMVVEEINPAEEDEDEPLDKDYDTEQLKSGILRELEITTNPYDAKKIAKNNLDEDKDYYKKIMTENEQNKKDSIFIVKDKLDIIANRRYGRNYDALLDREKSKVLFSTDIEKGTNDEINKELTNHYVKKTVEDNIDKIINTDNNIKEENSKYEFFEKLNDVRDNVEFFGKLKEIRRIWLKWNQKNL